MALTGLHTNWQYGSYTEDRNNFLGAAENRTGQYTRPYFDGSIAIGYGFDLIQHSATEISSYLNRINDALGLQGDQRVTLTQNDINLLIEARAATPTRREDISQLLSLTFPSQNYAASLRDTLLGDYETALDTALGGSDQLGDSKERMAVLSLLYTLTTPTSSAIIAVIPKTIAAIQKDNRAEAWYEIRYGSNSDFEHANRRYAESDLFGLYDAGTTAENISDAEAKEVMRMYTRYQTQTLQNNGYTMLDYEVDCPPPSGTKNLLDSISIAQNHLIFTYASGTTIDGEVIIGAGLQNYSYLENNPNDYYIQGTDKNELLLGEQGNDILIGGKGNDVMRGGAGRDLYVYNSGDGNDIIVDNPANGALDGGDGKGAIVYDGHLAGGGIKKAGESDYKSLDNTLTYQWSGNNGDDLTIIGSGGTLTVKGFTNGDLGITLKDAPDIATNFGAATRTEFLRFDHYEQIGVGRSAA